MFLRSLYAQPRRVRQRRGGWRQQAAAPPDAVDPADDLVAVSRLGTGLLRDWADGYMSATQVQQHAANAEADGLNDPLIKRLSKVGTGQNAHGGLMQLLHDVGVMDLLSEVRDSPAWKHVILPSAWIARICSTDPREFRKRFGADARAVGEFGENFLRRPQGRKWAEQHPCL